MLQLLRAAEVADCRRHRRRRGVTMNDRLHPNGLLQFFSVCPPLPAVLELVALVVVVAVVPLVEPTPTEIGEMLYEFLVEAVVSVCDGVELYVLVVARVLVPAAGRGREWG